MIIMILWLFIVPNLLLAILFHASPELASVENYFWIFYI